VGVRAGPGGARGGGDGLFRCSMPGGRGRRGCCLGCRCSGVGLGCGRDMEVSGIGGVWRWRGREGVRA